MSGAKRDQKKPANITKSYYNKYARAYKLFMTFENTKLAFGRSAIKTQKLLYY